MTRKGQAVRHSAPPLPAWVWLLAGFALGVGLSAVLIFRDWSKEKVQQVPKPAPSASIAEMASSEPAAERKPRYDFYNVLPEMEVVIPDAELKESSKRREPKEPENLRYFLQVGSFPAPSEADGLKARLALMGVQTQVSKVEVNGTTWHRVRSGPYATTKALEAAKQSLVQNNVEAIALREAKK